jgi:hypothetical protein
MNDLKVKTNDEVLKAEAANKYWQKHDYDLLTVQYFDPSKEKKF